MTTVDLTSAGNISGMVRFTVRLAVPWLFIAFAKDRKFYRVNDAQRTENGRFMLMPGPGEPVSGGPGFDSA